MRILADEGVELQIVERLRVDGHEVLYVAEFEPGVTDEAVLGKASDLSALLMTQDKDFGELVFRQGLAVSGVVLLRLPGLPASVKATLVSSVLREHGSEVHGAFMVIGTGTVHIRSLSE